MRTSAGLLLYRRSGDGTLRLLLGHPGGPFWAAKDDGVWSIPKGEYGPEEDARTAALREFAEELGAPPPDGPDLDLGQARQSAKLVTAFAREGDFDAATAVSNTVPIEWPPRSGRTLLVPELDRVEWCDPATARRRLIRGQVVFVDRLEAALAR